MATTVANLVIRPGDAYSCRINYVNEAGTAINITGETVTLTITADNMTAIALTSGSGLTINYTIGQIDAALTSLQTTSLDKKSNRRYTLRLGVAEKMILVGDIEDEPR